MHRTRIDGRVPVADMHLEVMGAPSPDPDLTITPAQARALAVELMERADAAEGYEGPHGFVARWEVLAKLDYLTSRIEELELQVVREP